MQEYPQGYGRSRFSGRRPADPDGLLLDIPVEEPEKLIAHLVKEHRLTEEEGKFWFTGYIEETAGRLHRPVRTAFSIINGLNRGAQYIADPLRRDEMERIAATILAPSCKASQEEMRSHWDGLAKKSSKLKVADYRKYQWLSATCVENLQGHTTVPNAPRR